MNFLKNYLIILLSISFFFIDCSTVPITGRKQLNLIPTSEMLAMSFQQYDQFLKENKISSNAEQTAMVKDVGHKIANAVEKFLRDHDMAAEIKNYKWEFNLIESQEVNAWCMPGGKVVFYTGILPVTQTEAGIAVVMGHEIAHAVAEHGNERMSQSLIAELGGVALSEAVKSEPAQTQQLWMAAYGLGATVGVLLPFSRTHESESDRLGLIFMAMAGYNPQEAVNFWKRMAAQKGGSAPPEFLSTHPADETRIKDLQNEIPEAMKYYKGN